MGTAEYSKAKHVAIPLNASAQAAAYIKAIYLARLSGAAAKALRTAANTAHGSEVQNSLVEHSSADTAPCIVFQSNIPRAARRCSAGAAHCRIADEAQAVLTAAIAGPTVPKDIAPSMTATKVCSTLPPMKQPGRL